MDQSLDTKLIISLAHEAVKQLAPNELPLFPAISAKYARKPDSFLNQQLKKDDILAFDAKEVEILTTVIIFSVLTRTFVDISVDATKKGAGTLLGHLRKKLWKPFSASKSDEKLRFAGFPLDGLRTLTYETAIQCGRTEAAANQLADSLVRELERNDQKLQLRDALLSAFPTRSDLERMVYYGLHENLSAIAAESNLQQTVFELIRWSDARGRLNELVTEALKQNSQNPQLISVVQQLGLEDDQNRPSSVDTDDTVQQIANSPEVLRVKKAEAEITE